MKRPFRHQGEEDKTPYHYKECGLDDVYLLSGYEIHYRDGEEGVSIQHEDELQRAIGLALVMEKKILSGKAIRFLRNEMDLTQAELGQLLVLTDQSVARWEKGFYPVPGAADRALRFLYLGHVHAKVDLRQLAQELNKMDATDEDMTFKQTGDSWKQCA